ncbi:general glycosylation pathway protein [Halomonas sp. CKK8]|uniref:general glycosylation pathway protein n=1 Tax=Halomonas sp. CKK8 TaxID=3036127 RepID=UPI0024151EAC|nr:general glycosylation pathway protein [Halomonas sp. CKK8]WFM70349.1 general glycosylation pathway protein [Halomonas sp. CKK8]
MNQAKNVSDFIGRAVYGVISLSLGVISLTMMGVALWDIWLSVHERTLLIAALLNAIGLIVIGMAVFDVAKFLLEEEVFSSSAKKSPAKQREALLKFLVIIAIAVSLESLVFMFDAGSKDISTLVYPTFLLISAVLLVVGLGVYQRLTRDEAK